MIRRLIILCLVLLLACPAALSEAVSPPSRETEQLLLSQALSLCSLMDACTKDPEYAKLYGLTGNGEFEAIGRQGWTHPDSVWMYVIKDRLYTVFLSASGVDFAGMSEPVQRKMREAIPSSLNSLINAGEPTEFLQVSSALRCGKVFAEGETICPAACLLYLSFPDGYDGLCSFVKTEGGLVSAYLSPVKKGGMERLLRQLKRAFIQEKDLFDEYEIDLIN